MLYLLAEWLGFEGLFNLVRYQTFRAGATLMTALVIGLFIGPRFINMLRVRQGKGQPIRADGPESHQAKVGTPTMGGLMILVSLSLSLLLWMDLSNPFVWACLAVTLGFGIIGFVDDYDKVTKNSHAGLSGRIRLLLEFGVAGVASYLIVSQINTNLYIPFFSDVSIPLGPFYYVFAAFVMVGGRFYGSTHRQRPSLWATLDLLHWAERLAQLRLPRTTRSSLRLSAGCLCSRRCRSSSKCSGSNARASGCSAWPRSIIISSSSVGARVRLSSGSGSSPSSSP